MSSCLVRCGYSGIDFLESVEHCWDLFDFDFSGFAGKHKVDFVIAGLDINF